MDRRDVVVGLGVLVALVLVGTGCQSMYYGTMERLGQHKRDILVDRVEDARDDQAEAKEQFQSALARFSEVVGFEGGDLRRLYEALRKDLDRSEDKAARVRERIESIEDVGAALFEEWRGELETFSDPALRERSETRLAETEARYGQLIAAMKRAEASMEPVLVTFRDHVMSLKHELNAQAVAALQGNLVSLETDIARLVAEMEAAIAEADSFIERMSG